MANPDPEKPSCEEYSATMAAAPVAATARRSRHIPTHTHRHGHCKHPLREAFENYSSYDRERVKLASHKASLEMGSSTLLIG